ncbi:MAG: HypC/HybG/HupF family hydrogenase formation chaperone [Helicobacteraceae bacterium]
MCLSIPSQIVEINASDNTAVIDTLGVRRTTSLDLMSEPVAVGDYVLIHVGFAMGKISKEEALESIKVYQEIVKSMDADGA